MKNILFFLICAFSLTNCSDPKLNCAYNITPTINIIENGDTTYSANIVGYVFYTDTTKAVVASYEDAKNGLLTERVNNTKISYTLKGEYTESNYSLFSIFDIKNKDFVVVACDTVEKIYAYRNANTENGLSNIYVNLPFYAWKLTSENPTYNINGWVVSKE